MGNGPGLTLTVPLKKALGAGRKPPSSSPHWYRQASTVMNFDSFEGEFDPKQLSERINNLLLTLSRTLATVSYAVSVSLYDCKLQGVHCDPSDWICLEETHAMYKGQSDHFQWLWTRLRAAYEKKIPSSSGDQNSSGSELRPLEKSPSPLGYQSEAGRDGRVMGKGEERVVPMDIDPEKAEDNGFFRPPTPGAHPSTSKWKIKVCWYFLIP